MNGGQNRAALQRLVAAGWPPPPPEPPYRWLGPKPDAAQGTLVAIHPTILPRFASGSAVRDEIVAQLATLPGPVTLIIGVQFATGGDPESVVMPELERLKGAGVALFAFAMAGRGKIHSLNVAMREAERLCARGVLLLDDDIELRPGCLIALDNGFRALPQPCAVGAVKIGRPHNSRAGRLLYRLKQFTQPATNYPHACCTLISLDTVHGGLSPHHHSDDGQICFRLLRPDEADPLGRLRLVDGARCGHVVGATTGATLRRLNRMLHHHAICMADAPWPSARYYFQQMLFHGLWPLAPFDMRNGVRRGLAKWLIKAVYFTWFGVIVVRLAALGAVGRTIRDVNWGGEYGLEGRHSRPSER